VGEIVGDIVIVALIMGAMSHDPQMPQQGCAVRNEALDCLAIVPSPRIRFVN